MGTYEVKMHGDEREDIQAHLTAAKLLIVKGKLNTDQTYHPNVGLLDLAYEHIESAMEMLNEK